MPIALLLALVLAGALALTLARRHGMSLTPFPHAHMGKAPPLGAQGAPVFEPRAPTRMSLETAPLGVSPDGFARWLVRVRFWGPRGTPVRLVQGGDIGFVPTHGTAQWQTRLRFGAPAAIVATTLDGPLGIAVRANDPRALGLRHAATDTRLWNVTRVVARALGPHAVQIGWFPAAAGVVQIRRIGVPAPLATSVPAPSSTYRDASVQPGSRVRYTVTIPGRGRFAFAVRVPAEPAHRSISALAGKGMWLSFSPSTRDPDGYDKLDPPALVRRAVAAGITSIELRTAYGPFSEITTEARPAVDALLDAAAERRIAVVAWTVPRGTDFDDLERAVQAASYRTRSGSGFAALALDLERGEQYLGTGAAAYTAIVTYATRLRAALGPDYPLVATVEDPYLEHLDGSDYPYAALARSVDALQPMAYWRMMSAHAQTPEAVTRIVRASYAATLRAAGRPIPIDVGGQTSAEGPRGAPPPGEIAAAVRAARAAGAFGVTFFDWNGTNAAQWAALARTPWGEHDRARVRLRMPRARSNVEARFGM